MFHREGIASINFIRSERFRRLFREGLWIVIGQAFAVLGSLVGVRLMTELLNPAAYGELALGMTVAMLVNQIVLGPLNNGITRFYAPALEQGSLFGYLKAVRRLLLLASGLIVPMILLAVVGLLLDGRNDLIVLAISALIFAFLSGYNSILNGIQNAARQRSIVALHGGIEPWARFLVAAGLMVLFAATSTIALVGYAMATVLVLLSQYVFFRKAISRNISKYNEEEDWRKQIWKFSRPFAIWGIFTWVQLASDRWALNLFGSTQDVGLYAVLFQLGYYPISIATVTAMQFFLPFFFQRSGDASDGLRNANMKKLCWRLTGLTLIVTGAVFIAVLLFHSQIFRLLAADEYASASYLLPWLVLAGGIFAAGQIISIDMMSQMKTQTMMAPKIMTALFGVALNFAGAYLYGTTGVVIACLLFSISYFLWMAAISKFAKVEECLS